jgi:hypothetical protein
MTVVNAPAGVAAEKQDGGCVMEVQSLWQGRVRVLKAVCRSAHHH